MQKKEKDPEIIVDATNIPFGRLASKVALLLRGKNKVTFQPHIMNMDIIHVININKAKLTGKKQIQKTFKHYTGFPGGLKSKNVSDFTPAKLFKEILVSMLPSNRTRRQILKRLIIE